MVEAAQSGQLASGDTVSRTARARIIDGGPAQPSLARRCVDLSGWIVPSGILALLPKCPACVAAYVAMGTGVGISLPTATYGRMLLVVHCVASLVYASAKCMRRIVDRISFWWVGKSVFGRGSAHGSKPSQREILSPHSSTPQLSQERLPLLQFARQTSPPSSAFRGSREYGRERPRCIGFPSLPAEFVPSPPIRCSMRTLPTTRSGDAAVFCARQAVPSPL